MLVYGVCEKQHNTVELYLIIQTNMASHSLLWYQNLQVTAQYDIEKSMLG